MKKKGIIAVLAIAMTSAIASIATGCQLVDNIKQKIEQAKCEHATEVVTEIEPATCTESGLTEGVKCGDCDKWIVEPDEIPALGHELVKDEAVPATCLKSGLTEGSHCSRCEETIKKQETVKATGHKLVTVEAKEATCTEVGYTAGQMCEVCGVIYQGCEEVATVAHTIGDDSFCTVCGTFDFSLLTDEANYTKTTHTPDDDGVMDVVSGRVYRVPITSFVDGYNAYGCVETPFFNAISENIIKRDFECVNESWGVFYFALVVDKGNGNYDLTSNFSQYVEEGLSGDNAFHYYAFDVVNTGERVFVPVDYTNFDECFSWQVSEDGSYVDIYVKDTNLEYQVVYEGTEGKLELTGTATVGFFGNFEEIVLNPTAE